jgi:hypothetical protein
MAADPGARAELGGAALDHFEACGSKFEVRKRDGSGDTVVEVTSEAAFPVAFNLRIQEALQYITAKTAIWRARLENEGNELHLELASPWRKSARTQFSPPISPASIEFCEHGWPLFGRYLSYVVQKTEGTHWNPVAYHLYNACEATASSVDAWAGGVSIAVEAVASLINVEDDKQRGERLTLFQERARKWLAEQSDLADLADRVRGQINSMSKKLPEDTLYALAESGHVVKAYIKTWRDLRNRHVHPTLKDLKKPDPVDYQKLLDHIHRVETLLAILAATGAYAKPHHQITDAQREDCLMTDNDDDGTEWCVKSGKGMTQEQIDAWYKAEGARDNAKREAEFNERERRKRRRSILRIVKNLPE